MRKHLYIKRLCLGFGIDKELWYTTRKNNSRLYAIFHIGFCPDYCPDVGVKLSVFNITLPFTIFTIGWIKRISGYTAQNPSQVIHKKSE